MKSHALEFSREERAVLLALLRLYRSEDQEGPEDKKYRDDLESKLEQPQSLSELDNHVLMMSLQSAYTDLNAKLKMRL